MFEKVSYPPLKKFLDLHKVDKLPDDFNDDLFNANNIEYNVRWLESHGFDHGDDETVYHDLNQSHVDSDPLMMIYNLIKKEMCKESINEAKKPKKDSSEIDLNNVDKDRYKTDGKYRTAVNLAFHQKAKNDKMKAIASTRKLPRIGRVKFTESLEDVNEAVISQYHDTKVTDGEKSSKEFEKVYVKAQKGDNILDPHLKDYDIVHQNITGAGKEGTTHYKHHKTGETFSVKREFNGKALSGQTHYIRKI